MQFIRELYNLKQKKLSCVVSIGNFDGVHIGHQKLFSLMREKAKALGVPTLLIIFEPQPAEFFHQQKSVARLTRLREKLPLFQDQGIDYVLCLRFTEKFSHLSPEDFVKQVLLDRFQIQHLLVGDDFRFGYERKGDFNYLVQVGKVEGFTVEKMPTVYLDKEERISSTAVRKALVEGDLDKAAILLGRPYGMIGRVAHGSQRGRIIGFPTANIHLHRQVSPILGVYAVTLRGIDDKVHYGVANVGNRPTVDGTRTLLEVHLFDFKKDIYGSYVEVDFAHKLRDERRFESFDALKEQIFKDAQEAREYFQNLVYCKN